MNPHDPAERPGAHLVAEEFGVDSPWALTGQRPPGDPLDVVGRMVAEAARDVDDLHGELTRAARSAIALLEPLARGEHLDPHSRYGVLRTTGPHIDALLARRGAAYDQLTRSITACRRLASEPPAAQTPSPGKDNAPARNDDWTIAGDRRFRALEAVEAGELRFHESPVFGYTYLSDGQGLRPTPAVWPETVKRLVTDGLLAQDTSESLYRPGQLLSLTPQGEAALRDARTAAPRLSAALSRSSTAPVSAAAPPAEPAAGTRPSRSR